MARREACAGVWLEKCTTLGSVRLVLSRLWHTVIVRDAIALELLLTLLSLVLLFPPIFLAAIFSTYEAPQLEANMKSAGITPPAAFLLCWELFDLVIAYGFLFLAAPISVFYSICNAKLFQQTHLRE